MKTFKLVLIFQLLAVTFMFSQTQTIIGNQTSINQDESAPDDSAILDVSSTDKGMLLPRMTTAQRTIIASPATDLLVFDTDFNQFFYYYGGSWVALSTGVMTWQESVDTVYNTTHNIGIGTTNPSTELEVDGTITTDGLTMPTGAVDDYILQTNASGGAAWINSETGIGWRRANNTTVYNTGDSVGINTSDPIRPVHIMGSTTLSSMVLTPNEPFSGDDASIILTEEDDDTYHMEMTYDGGDNRMYWYGKNNANLNGPHVGINRDNGRVGIGTGTVNPVSELEVVGTVTATAFDAGDASGLSNVFADSLRGSMTADTNDLLQWNGAYWNRVPYGRYAFHASASTDQTVGDTAYDTLRCNNSSSGENFECPAGVYDNATFAFEAPVDGIYFFEAAALWDNANLAEGRNAIFIRVNNTDEVGE